MEKHQWKALTKGVEIAKSNMERAKEINNGIKKVTFPFLIEDDVRVRASTQEEEEVNISRKSIHDESQGEGKEIPFNSGEEENEHEHLDYAEQVRRGIKARLANL